MLGEGGGFGLELSKQAGANLSFLWLKLKATYWPKGGKGTSEAFLSCATGPLYSCGLQSPWNPGYWREQEDSEELPYTFILKNVPSLKEKMCQVFPGARQHNAIRKYQFNVLPEVWVRNYFLNIESPARRQLSMGR